MKNLIRYHIQLKNHRTTVSLDKIISDLMAIKLGETPGTKQAHSAVRQQLERSVSDNDNTGLVSYALYKIRKEAILFIADTVLSEKYLDNWDQYQKNEPL